MGENPEVCSAGAKAHFGRSCPWVSRILQPQLPTEQNRKRFQAKTERTTPSNPVSTVNRERKKMFKPLSLSGLLYSHRYLNEPTQKIFPEPRWVCLMLRMKGIVSVCSDTINTILDLFYTCNHIIALNV